MLELCAGQHGGSQEGDLVSLRNGQGQGHFLKVVRPKQGPSRVSDQEDSAVNGRTRETTGCEQRTRCQRSCCGKTWRQGFGRNEVGAQVGTGSGGGLWVE